MFLGGGIGLGRSRQWTGAIGPSYEAETNALFVPMASRGAVPVLDQTAVGAAVGVLGPLLGGMLFSYFGPASAFGVAGFFTLVSVLPLVFMVSIETGPTPDFCEALRAVDRNGFVTFVADGLLASGLAVAWPMVLFISVGSRFDAFGLVNAAAGSAGAVSGLLCGRAIDRGSRAGYAAIVCFALGISVLLRVCSGWSALAATLANISGAAVMGFYVPVLISEIYDRAKLSGRAYKFHVVTEAGWDIGAASGCAAGAIFVALGAMPSLSVLPALLGVVIISVTLCGGLRAAGSTRPARGGHLAS
jgi:hypothetical protein